MMHIRFHACKVVLSINLEFLLYVILKSELFNYLHYNSTNS